MPSSCIKLWVKMNDVFASVVYSSKVVISKRPKLNKLSIVLHDSTTSATTGPTSVFVAKSSSIDCTATMPYWLVCKLQQ